MEPLRFAACVVGLALAVAVAVSGCGGSSGSARTNTAGASLSSQENQLCSVLVDNLSKLPAISASGAFVRSYKLEARYLGSFVSDLRALKAPKPDAAEFASFIDGNEYALGVFRRLLPYIVANHLKQAVPLMRHGAIADSQLRVLAKHLNLSACATGQSHAG